MKELTPKEKRKVEKLLRVVEDGDAAVVEHLLELEEKVEDTASQLKQEFKETVAEIKQAVPDMASMLEQIKGKDGKDGESIVGPPGPKGVDGKSVVGPAGRDGRDGKDAPPVDTNKIALEASAMAVDEISPLIPSIEEIEADLPKLGAPIRDSLELLRDEDRLDVTAIRGITVSPIAPINPEIGDLWIKT